jgi:hypothetical protein
MVQKATQKCIKYITRSLKMSQYLKKHGVGVSSPWGSLATYNLATFSNSLTVNGTNINPK